MSDSRLRVARQRTSQAGTFGDLWLVTLDGVLVFAAGTWRGAMVYVSALVQFARSTW